jgi:hypothetical protein
MSAGISSTGGSDSKVLVNSLAPPKSLTISGAGVSITNNSGNGTYDIVISGTGTITGASAGGTGGVGLVLTPSGGTLEFKNISAGSSAITITDDTVNHNVKLDAPLVTSGNAGVVPALTNVGTQYLDATGAWSTPSGTGTGEANTASNAGLAGVGITLTKSGVNLPFKAIEANSSKISVTDDATNKAVAIDVNQGNLSLASIGGTAGYSQLNLTGAILNTDIATAAGIPYSKLNLATSIVNADVSASAAIAKSKLASLAIADADTSTYTTTKISTTSKSLLNSAIVYNDQTNTFGAFDQVIPGGSLKLSASTFKTTIAATPTANRTITIPDTTDTLVVSADSRLTNARTPTTHASSHQSGGSDSIALDTLAVPTDITTLNSTTSAHGLLKKLSGTATQYMDGSGAWSTPAGGGGGVSASSPNTWSAVQTFNDGDVALENPLGTFAATVKGGAQTGNVTFTFPVTTSDTIETINATQTVTNKSISGSSNTITNLSDSAISASAAIAYSKLNLATSILNADISGTAAIAKSKLAALSIGDSDTSTYTTTKISTTSKALLNSAIVYNDQANTFGSGNIQFFQTGNIAIVSGSFSTTLAVPALAASKTLTFPNSTDTMVGRATTDTLTNKTLTTPIISSISNTGTLTLPTSTDTLVGRATTDTLTNKTLTTPIISSISNTGALTLPTSTDTLTGRATTDTLTNKTINSASNTITLNASSGTLTDTSTAAGDILKSNGTKFTRLARGTANQVLTVNSGGTDIAWAAASGGLTLSQVYSSPDTSLWGSHIADGSINYTPYGQSARFGTPTGVPHFDLISSEGLYLSISSGTTIGGKSGTLDNLTSPAFCMDMNAYLKVRCRFSSSGSISRVMLGYSAGSSTPTTDTLVASSTAACILGCRTTDTNYQGIVSNGTGAATYNDTGVAYTTTGFHTYEIQVKSNGTCVFTIDGSVVVSTSTNTPTTGQGMHLHCYVTNSTTTAVSGDFKYDLFRSDF